MKILESIENRTERKKNRLGRRGGERKKERERDIGTEGERKRVRERGKEGEGEGERERERSLTSNTQKNEFNVLDSS
jgi:hypothetical protein